MKHRYAALKFFTGSRSYLPFPSGSVIVMFVEFSSGLPSPHANLKTKRLAQETFPGFHVLLVQLEFVPSENG